MCNLLCDRSEEIIPPGGLYNLLLWMIEEYDSDNEDPIAIPLDAKHRAQSPKY